MKTNRRDFLKLSAGALLGAGAVSVLPSEAEAAHKDEFAPGTMAKLYDSTKCIACQTCVVACHETNFLFREKNYKVPKEERNFIEREDVIPKFSEEDEFSTDKPWMNVVGLDYRYRTVIQKHVDDNEKVHFIKHNCMHCLKPGCVSACPVSALQKEPDTGIVTYDENRCIGCRYCQMACPFLVPAFEWHRAIPKISKCDMCRSTINKKDGGEGTTACVKVCPTGAVIYGKRSDLLAEAHRRIDESKAKGENKYYEDLERGESVLGEKIYGGTGELVLAGAGTTFQKLGYPIERIGDNATAYKSEGIQHTIYKYGIAPVALYTALSIFVYRNTKKHHKGEE